LFVEVEFGVGYQGGVMRIVWGVFITRYFGLWLMAPKHECGVQLAGVTEKLNGVTDGGRRKLNGVTDGAPT